MRGPRPESITLNLLVREYFYLRLIDLERGFNSSGWISARFSVFLGHIYHTGLVIEGHVKAVAVEFDRHR